MSIARTAPGGLLTDDDGSGTTGTILNNSERQSMLDLIDARWSLVYVTATGSQNNVSITSGGVEADVMVCSNASDLTITGIVAPASPAKPGKLLTIIAAGAGHVYLSHMSASSSAANRLYNKVGSGPTPLTAGSGRATYCYLGSEWYLIHHDQGDYISATFAAGNFTGNGAMTWTVASGDRATGWKLVGTEVHFYFTLTTTSVGGTPNTMLQISNSEWGGFTAEHTIYSRPAYANDNGTIVDAVLCHASSTTVFIHKSAGTNWTAATDNTSIYGTLRIPVS